MKKLLIVATIIVTAMAFAEPRSIEEIMNTPVNELTPEEHAIRTAHVKDTKLRIFGEDIIKPGSQQGRIAIVNAQDKLPALEIDKTVAMLYRCAKFKFDIMKEAATSNALDMAASACNRLDVNIAILIVNDGTTPAMLVAPEDRWAIVNVGKLDVGLTQGPLYSRMFNARCRKEIVRAFSLLCGGGSSQFAQHDGNLFDPRA